jgi:hypothetical protein
LEFYLNDKLTLKVSEKNFLTERERELKEDETAE